MNGFLLSLFTGRQLVDTTLDTSDLQHELNSEPDISQNWSNMHSHMTSGITNPAYMQSTQRPKVRS